MKGILKPPTISNRTSSLVEQLMALIEQQNFILNSRPTNSTAKGRDRCLKNEPPRRYQAQQLGKKEKALNGIFA